jgi:ADP-ribose pyrophosphatase YjhB (NUDIX family)
MPTPTPPQRPPDFHVAVDVVLFSIRHDLLHVAVVQRQSPDAYVDQNHVARRGDPRAKRRVQAVPRDPALHWALPGGHVGHTLLGAKHGTGSQPDESLEQAALRVLSRETSVTLSEADLHQTAAFGDSDRDPRSGRTISVAFLAVVPDDCVLTHDDEAHVSTVEFRPVIDMLARPKRLEFDHEDIVLRAIQRVRTLVVTSPFATSFCRNEFTIGELRRVYEVLFHESLDNAANAERPEYVDAVRTYLAKLERLSPLTDPSFERTVTELASYFSSLSSRDDRLELRLEKPASEMVFEAVRIPHNDLARQADLVAKLRRHGGSTRSPRPPRLLRSLDPTNFSRKIHKLDFLESVQGGSRPSFDRYGKPAALFRLQRDREYAPFLLRLDRLGKSDDTDR